MNEPVIKNIKSLPKNNTYLKNELNIYPKIRVTFYEKQNGDYIERYTILKTPERKVLMEDSFYPKALENEIKPYVIRALNNDMTWYHNADAYTSDDIEPEDD